MGEVAVCWKPVDPVRTLLLGVACLELVSLFSKAEGWSWVYLCVVSFQITSTEVCPELRVKGWECGFLKVFDLKRMALHDWVVCSPPLFSLFQSLFPPPPSRVWVFVLPLGNSASGARTERFT